MGADLSFRCRCGAVAGRLRDVSRDKGLRYVCHCDDCQVFAFHLGRSDLLDAHGGTDAFQTDASRLQVEKGLERLACLRVANIKARPTLRWYAACCGTPLFNSSDRAQTSFFGVVLSAADRARCDAILGPSRGIVWRKFAAGDVSGLPDANLLMIVGRMIRRVIVAGLTGDWRNTPLFDPQGAPIAEPYALGPPERAAAEAAMAEFRARQARAQLALD